VAIHHLPQFYAKSADAVSKGLDAACEHAGVWPDAFVIGHAHLYQRFIRNVNGKKIPYVITGNGGYKIVATQAARVDGVADVSDNVVHPTLGFVRVRATANDLTFTAISSGGEEIDSVPVALGT
jgi:hypothetical protein